ncbi:cytochrome P450 [Aspergillus sclerotiicarbonarius CBS 121057]|uniref:Cytochrome P450 n=1 Tax=Aspergillus sclerotiicarbonarius (strain CBS 121057 / IBT 28362) TaxID=1448318 RepID=A0A319DZL5_ASPSB|nr:cytochrome P450 [Aspergillus sclerotiicarbonarius CBS 121057]
MRTGDLSAGPRLAALIWWYEFYFDAIQSGRYIFKIQELHQQYGPIIRVTPDEIHINDVGYLDTVYAPSMARRDKYSYQLKSLRVPGGVGTTADHHLHKIRRETLAPFFSKRNVLSLEGLISAKVEQLCQLVRKHAVDKTVMNLSDAFFAFSNDVVVNFLFTHQVNVLADEEQAATLQRNSKELLMGINLNKQFPWVPDFLEALPLAISKPLMPPGLIDMLALFDRVRAELVSIINAKVSGTNQTCLSPTAKESVYSSVIDNPVLPESERTLLRLEQEGALLALAGTESPAQSLSIILYHVLANPFILERLRTELSTVPECATWTHLEQLPYLSAIIEEGNRLSFGKTYTIPPMTPISITTLSAHTAESVFPDAYIFHPDRWLGENGRQRRKFQLAFSKGGRKWLGIELARAELYLVTAALVRTFDLTLRETDADDVAFLHDYQVAMPRMGSRG